jgi:hypothetical protein
MWLRVPDAIEETVWEGELQPDDDDDVRRDSSSPGQPRDIRDLPVVSIGRPEVWTLPEFYGTEDLPAPVVAKLGDASFYLVRLSCSFRPTKNKTRVEWARLTITLHPDAAGRIGTAFDLHPLRVTQEVKRSVNVSLSPTLKFQEVQASIGGASFGLEYPELQPTISASGAGESEPSWDFSASAGERVEGSKWMHLLVKAPRTMTACEASLELTADIVGSGFRIPLFSRPTQTPAAPLTVALWGGG